MASTNEFELDVMDSKGLRHRSDVRDFVGGSRVKDEDTLALARSGKKQILDVG